MEVDSAHSRKLNEEAKTIYKADEEADSKTVGRYDKVRVIVFFLTLQNQEA
jgi:hypothetical protein